MTNLSETIRELDIPTSTSIDSQRVNEIITAKPFIPVSNVANLRQLTSPSRPHIVKPGYIYRSATLQALRPEGHDQLRGLGIKRIFDLRARYEVEGEPTGRIDGIENVWAEPLPKDEVTEGGSSSDENSLETLYRGIIKMYKPAYRNAFTHIRDHPAQPFLFHCFGGKDRTGILAALILEIAGATDEEIIYDYILTRAGLQPALEKLRDGNSQHPRAIDIKDPKKATVIETRASTIIGFLKDLRENYGGAEGYIMKELGFSVEDVETIRRHLAGTASRM